MSLEQWLSNSWLKRHHPTPQETEDLLSVVERDLRNCRLPGLDPDWRMSMAYNAALQAAAAALTACGYRVRKGHSYHLRTLQSLRYSIGAEPELVARLDAFRKKRNEMGYERAGVVSRLEADEMVEMAEELKARVEKWLHDEHPELL